ncbi:MAG TPA: ferritin-like domain-containing protein [Candidatus Angelobacter sp.]|nr:ferritin-like domain-containing protein [Candidatus Angelobacter sp.]
MKLESLQELFVEELQDLFSAEKMILKALPQMVETATSPELKKGFEQHLAQTRNQVQRLNQIFDAIPEVDRDGKKCKGMEGIIKDAKELIDSDTEPEVMDAGLIAGAQRVEHYEIAGYGTVANYAQLLGHNEWVQLLRQTLDEEKETDAKLTQLATSINLEAKAA